MIYIFLDFLITVLFTERLTWNFVLNFLSLAKYTHLTFYTFLILTAKYFVHFQYNKFCQHLNLNYRYKKKSCPCIINIFKLIM